MERIVLLSTIFICAMANAQVYKRVGPDGKVYFSDEPGPEAERIEVPPPQTISLPPVAEQNGAAQPQEDSSTPYSEFAVVSPTNEESIRANDGNITVTLSLQPALMPGHSVVLNVDGEDGEQVKSGGSLTIELNNMSRGLHTVQAKVVDADGNALIETGPASFYVLRVAVGGR